jgi:hypothetical protein
LGEDSLMSTEPDPSAASQAPSNEGVTEARAAQPASSGSALGRRQGWLRRNWWIVLIVAVAVIATVARVGIHARQVFLQQDALHRAQIVPGAKGPFEWGQTFWDKNGADQYWVKISVGAPVADSSAASGVSHSVRCDISVENNSGSDLTVSAEDFLMWESLKDGPLHPVEGTLETHLIAYQSATFTLHFVTTDSTTIGCVTCGGPLGSTANGTVWHQTYLQWGKLPVAPSRSTSGVFLHTRA